MEEHEVHKDDEETEKVYLTYMPAEEPEPPPDPGEGEAARRDENKAAWLRKTRTVAKILAARAANWEISEELQEELAETMAEGLAEILKSGPGQAEDWPWWAKLGLCGGTIVVLHGVDYDALPKVRLKPLSRPEKKPEPQPMPAPQEERPEGTKGMHGFTIG